MIPECRWISQKKSTFEKSFLKKTVTLFDGDGRMEMITFITLPEYAALDIFGSNLIVTLNLQHRVITLEGGRWSLWGAVSGCHRGVEGRERKEVVRNRKNEESSTLRRGDGG